jgi:7-cyano-7-deazaguanine reductase
MTTQDDVTGLKHLGSGKTSYAFEEPTSAILEAFPNQYPNRAYTIQFVHPEFTSLCPKTGQPDFATIEINYVPDELCIETKSLKLYFTAYRNHGSFMETITNKILDDLVVVCQPRTMQVIARFNPRGGTTLNVTAEFRKDNDAPIEAQF